MKVLRNVDWNNDLLGDSGDEKECLCWVPIRFYPSSCVVDGLWVRPIFGETNKSNIKFEKKKEFLNVNYEEFKWYKNHG